METNQNKQSKSIFSRSVFWIAIILAVVLVGFSYATINTRTDEKVYLDQPTFEVEQGPLTISISVAGTVQAREKEIIKSELEGQNAILYIVPEGTRVKKGDLLVELDASSLQDQLIEQQIKMLNAKANYVNARENLAISENQAQSDVDAAELQYKFAKQDLRQYIEGEFPKLQKEYQAEISLQEEELNQAQNDLKWSEILYEEKYLSQSELQTAQITAQRKKLNLDKAVADLNMLNDFTYHRQIAQLTSDVTQAEMELERTKRKAKASIVQASAELQSREAEYEQQVSKLEKIKDQIEKAKIYAPMDGLVVYATSVRQSWRGNQEPLREGQTVREREELIHLPTTSSYIVEAKVHESSLEKIRLDLPVLITIDALPGKSFKGRVSTIAPLPDAQSMFMNPDLKVYNTQINIEGNGEDLRSGMSCRAEIIIDQFNDTNFIPVQSVTRILGKPSVYVVKGNQLEQRKVELGPDDNSLVQIQSGLEKGETVLLTPPLSSSEVPKEQYEEYDIPEKKETASDIEPAEGKPPQAFPGRMDEASQQGERPQGMGNRQGRGMQRGQGRPNRPDMEGGPQGQGQRQERSRFGNMTDEQREEMRKRFENMTPEQREQMRKRFQQNRQRNENPE